MRKALAAAALGCGIALGAWAAPVDEQVLPAHGPLRAATVQRLLLLDAARAGGRIVAVGARGYILVSADQGATWSRARSPEAPLLTAVDFADAKDGWAVGHDSVILATTDGGDTWTQQFSAPSEQRPLLDVLFVSRETGFAVGAYGAYYETTDGGRSWNVRKIIPDDKHLNAIVQTAPGKLLIVGEAGTILVSDDGGHRPAGEARAHHVRPDDGRKLDLHRQPGDRPGDLRDAGRGGGAALRRLPARAGWS